MEDAINRYGNGFNFPFCGGHVQLVNRSYYLSFPNSWQNWNNDHQPHPETWEWTPPRWQPYDEKTSETSELQRTRRSRLFAARGR